MHKLVYTIVISDREYEKASKGILDFEKYFEGQIYRMLRHRLDLGATPTIECSLTSYEKIENL